MCAFVHVCGCVFAQLASAYAHTAAWPRARARACGRMCVRPWCPYAVTSPSTRQQPGPLHSSILHCHLKKAYHKFPVRFTSAPGGHKKAYLYWSRLPEIVFQREDISLCPFTIKGSPALQRANQIYQSNPGAGRHAEQSPGIEGVAKIKAHLAWTTLGCLAPLIFVYWITNSVTCCQATPRPPFNWRWHVSHRGLTSRCTNMVFSLHGGCCGGKRAQTPESDWIKGYKMFRNSEVVQTRFIKRVFTGRHSPL